jgi:ribonuclease BN (tRNA processing enzyme)
VCLDLGAGALNRLQPLVAPERLSAIVISHLHADHCVDLLSLRVYMEWGPGRGSRIRVVGPAGLREVLQGFAGDNGWDGFVFETLDESGGAIEIGSLRLTWTEVPHTKPTFALRIDDGAVSITYSADCGPNDALVALATQTDVLVAECSLGVEPSGDGAIHLSATDAATLAHRAGARRLLLTHCYPEHDRDTVLGEASAAFDGPVAWARQGEPVVVSTD